MTKERVLESQDVRTVYEGAAKRKAVDPFDWPWWFFVSVVFGTLILLIVLLWSI